MLTVCGDVNQENVTLRTEPGKVTGSLDVELPCSLGVIVDFVREAVRCAVHHNLRPALVMSAKTSVSEDPQASGGVCEVYGVLGMVKGFLNLVGRGQVDLEDCCTVCPGQARAFGSPVPSLEGLQDLSPQEAGCACDQSCSLSHFDLPSGGILSFDFEVWVSCV